MAGAASEGEQELGCAHLLEHMVFKSVEWQGRRLDIATEIERLGGDVNAYTSHDETVFHATVPRDAFSRSLSALCIPVLHPELDPQEVAREIEVVREEIRLYDDDLASKTGQDALELLYGDHRYARPVAGRLHDVAHHSRATIRAFHRRHYKASQMVLVVVGAIAVDEVMAQAEVVLGDIPRGRPDKPIDVPPILHRPRVRVHGAETSEVHIAAAWAGPPLPESSACALDVASLVLGYGEASRLAVARRRQQVVTDVSAHFYSSRRTSSVLVSATTTMERAEAAALALIDHIESLTIQPIGDDELRRARAVLVSDLVYRQETVQGQAHAMGYQASLGRALDLEQRYFAALASLTPDAVQKACAEYLALHRVAMTMVIPRTSGAGRDVASAIRRRVRTSTTKRKSPPIRHRLGYASVDFKHGLRLRAKIDRSVPMAAGWMVWPGGLWREANRDLGSSPLLARLLTRGCATIDGDALSSEIEGRAAVLEGFSGRNSVGLHFECLSADVDLLVQRMFECADAPSLTEEELDEERRVALEELQAEADDPAGMAFRAAYQALYRGHPYGRRRHGTETSLSQITAKRLRRLWTQYPLERAVIGFGGDVDLERVAAMIASQWDRVRDSSDATPSVKPPRFPRRKKHIRLTTTKEQAHFVLAFAGLGVGDPRLPTLGVLELLLGGQVGPLFTALREREGLVYSVAVNASEGIDAGHITIYGASSHDKVQTALARVYEELARFGDDMGQLKRDVIRSKRWLRAQHEVEMQRRSRLASQLAFDEAFGLGIDAQHKHFAAMRKVDAHAVVDLARELLDVHRAIEVLVTRP